MQLTKNEKFFESVLSELQGDIAVFDLDHRYLYVNPQAIRNPEIRKWIIGKTDFEYCTYRNVNKSIAKSRYDSFIKVLKEKREFELEEKIIDQSGAERIYLRRLSPVFNEFGEISFVIGYGMEITERKKLGADLEESTNFMKNVLNTSPHLIYIKDWDGRFLLVNQAMADIFNTDIQDLINRSNEEVHTNKSENSSYTIVDHQVISNNERVRIEEKFTKEDGTVLWFDTIKVPFRSNDGITNVLGVSTDITERKLAEEKILQSKLRLNEAQGLTKSGSWEFDIHSKALSWSKGMFRIWERDFDLGIPSIEEIFSTVQLDEKTSPEVMMQKIIEIGDEVKREYTIKVKSGIKNLNTIARPVRDVNGNLVSIFGTVIDVSEQKRNELMLRESEMRLKEAQALTKSGNWELDADTQIVRWSDNMFKIWEIENENETPSLDIIYSFIHKDDIKRIQEQMSAILETKQGSEFEYRIVTPSSIKFLRTNARPLIDGKGKVFRIYGTVIDLTEQKLAEELLRENELRLNELQELAKIGSFKFQINPFNSHWSPGCFAIWKRDPKLGPLAYEEFLATVHPDDLQYIIDQTNALNHIKQPYESFYRIICADGEEKSLHVINNPQFDVNGNLLSVFGSVADITERTKTEQQLIRNEQRLLEAQELALSGSWEYDLVTGKNLWSAGHYKLWDLDPKQPAPSFEMFQETIHPDDRKKMMDLMNHEMSVSGKADIRYRMTSFKGVEKIMFSKAVFELDKNQRPIRMYGTVIDVTERTERDETLRISEQKLIQAQELANFGSWQYYIDSGLLEWSLGTYKIWDRDPESGVLTYEEYITSIHEEDRLKIKNTIENAIENNIGFNFEYRIITEKGNLKICEGRGRTITDSSGKVGSMFGTVIDITERKKFEQELVEANRYVEETVKAKEYFLANVSHELRTPLNGVLGMARLLQKTELSSIQRNYIQILSSTAENLLVIINDILDIAKIESGKLIFEQKVFDPVRVADTVVQTQLYKAEEKDIILRHIIDAKPFPLLIGDPNRLNQILLNLLSNAIKFTEQGEVLVTQKLIEEDDDAVLIEFSVKDSGVGIAQEQQVRIFESFTQVHSGSNVFNEGTGLGLTITKNLVTMQGGNIFVESELGIGSTFSFNIPYKKADHIVELKPSTERIDPEQLGTLRVLLAEDNRVNQFITEAMLQDWGFIIDVAVNGREAVDLVAKNHYNIILMDIQMPELNGVDATHLIRAMKDPVKSKIPIIALTANTTRNAQKKFLAEGMNDCLVKPFKEETLFKKILSHLEGNENMQVIQRPRFPARMKPQPSNENFYDLTMLRRDARNNPEFIRRMLGIFIDTIPPIVDKMLEHFEKGEMDAISTLAHKIKPTLHGAGILILRDTIRNIESYRERKRTREQLLTDLNYLKQIISIVVESLKTEIDSTLANE